MNDTEIWRDIPGTDGLYQASTFGRIRSLHYRNTKEIRLLSPTPDRGGYPHASVKINGKYKTFNVHRIIAMTFLEPVEGKNHVDHIDGNKLNNSVSNLRWVSQKENNNFELYRKHNSEAKKRGCQKPEWKKKESDAFRNRKDQSIPVEQYRENGTYKRTFPSMAEASRETGIDNNSISKCCNGKLKTAGHYIWKFAS